MIEMEQSFLQLLLGSAMNIVTFVLVSAGVMKLFQAASDIRDMRQMLQNRLRGAGAATESATDADGYPHLSGEPGDESLQNLAQVIGLKPTIHPEVIPPQTVAQHEHVTVGAAPSRTQKATIAISKSLSW
jgi:hypothetical protein